MITGMLLASIGLAGCGKKSEDDITNKEIYQDDLEPLTEEELNEMDADTSDEDMKQIDEPEDETADITDTTDATETTDKTENTDKAEASDSSPTLSRWTHAAAHRPKAAQESCSSAVPIQPALALHADQARVRRPAAPIRRSPAPSGSASGCRTERQNPHRGGGIPSAEASEAR